MEKEAEKFLKAEETANKLVETLKQLHKEANSYQTATKQLDDVRQKLLSLIESSEKVVNGSHEVIKILKEIGGPEILNKIGEVKDKIDEELSKGVGELKNETLRRIGKVEDKIGKESSKLSKGVGELKKETLKRIGEVEDKIGDESSNLSDGVGELKNETLRRIGEVENKIGDESSKLSKGVGELKNETLRRIGEVENKMSEEFVNHSKRLKNLKIFIIATLTSSLIAIIVGILALLR